MEGGVAARTHTYIDEEELCQNLKNLSIIKMITRLRRSIQS